MFLQKSKFIFINKNRNKIKIEKDNLNREINQFLDFRAQEITKLDKEKLKYEKNIALSNDILNKTDIIDLDIGGSYKITTTKQTLQKYPNSLLSLLFDNTSKLQTYNNRIFIDRDGLSFMNLLFYLRNNKIPTFENEKDKKNFFDELEYWQIPYTNKEKKKSIMVFDKNWCAQTLQIDSSLIKLYKNNIQHGIVFCKPGLDENNSYIEFKITIKTACRNKSHLFIGLVDKKKYDLSKLISTFWKDSPSSFYWDTWTTKLIKTDDKGCQVGSISGYGCQCQSNETFLAMKYDASEKTLTYFKNGINLGVAFRNVPSGLNPSLDIWFEEGVVEIMKKGDYEEQKFL